MKIMVLDNNPMEGEAYAHIFSHVLHESHPDVEYIGQAFTCQEGIDLAKEAHPDVIFLDFGETSNIDGLTFIKTQKELFPQVLLVIITATQDASDLHRAFRYGINDYYLKPMSVSELSQLLDKLKDDLALKAGVRAPESSKDKYRHLIELAQSHKTSKNPAVLDTFWQMLEQERIRDLEAIKLQCIEFAATLMLYTPRPQNHSTAPLSLTYNRLVKELLACEQIEDIRQSLAAFTLDYSKLVNQMTPETGSEQVAKAKELIEQYIQNEQPVTLESIANEVYVSPYYLSRMFKKNEGINFVDYLQNCRLDYAKFLLKTTNETVMNITLRCGYSEANSFRRLFRQKVGLTPMEYRRNG